MNRLTASDDKKNMNCQGNVLFTTFPSDRGSDVPVFMSSSYSIINSKGLMFRITNFISTKQPAAVCRKSGLYQLLLKNMTIKQQEARALLMWKNPKNCRGILIVRKISRNSSFVFPQLRHWNLRLRVRKF